MGYNYVGGILGVLSGYLFSEAPRIDGIDVEDFVPDVDKKGTPWARFWRGVFTSSLVQRDCFVWVNAAEATGADTRADEEKAGAGPETLSRGEGRQRLSERHRTGRDDNRDHYRPPKNTPKADFKRM